MGYSWSAEESPATLTDDDTGEVVGKVEFRRGEGVLLLDHLWVEPARRGQGLARRVVDHFAADARLRDQKIRPLCGVARRMMEGDPRYEDVL